MTNFDTLFERVRAVGASPALRPLLAQFYFALTASPSDLNTIRESMIRLLEFLASPQGRTDANCQAVDSFVMLNETWSSDSSKLPDTFTDILADMSGALHDTISAPEIARNFDSTPEQLLERARLLPIHHVA